MVAQTFLDNLQLGQLGVFVNSLYVSKPQFSGLQNGVKHVSLPSLQG